MVDNRLRMIHDYRSMSQWIPYYPLRGVLSLRCLLHGTTRRKPFPLATVTHVHGERFVAFAFPSSMLWTIMASALARRLLMRRGMSWEEGLLEGLTV